MKDYDYEESEEDQIDTLDDLMEHNQNAFSFSAMSFFLQGKSKAKDLVEDNRESLEPGKRSLVTGTSVMLHATPELDSRVKGLLAEHNPMVAPSTIKLLGHHVIKKQRNYDKIRCTVVPTSSSAFCGHLEVEYNLPKDPLGNYK